MTMATAMAVKNCTRGTVAAAATAWRMFWPRKRWLASPKRPCFVCLAAEDLYDLVAADGLFEDARDVAHGELRGAAGRRKRC